MFSPSCVPVPDNSSAGSRDPGPVPYVYFSGLPTARLSIMERSDVLNLILNSTTGQERNEQNERTAPKAPRRNLRVPLQVTFL